LGEVDAKSEIGCLANLLDDPHEPVRAGAALSLARLGDSRGTKVLINLVKERGDLAMDAALALGELGACEALDEMHRISAQLFTSKELKAMIAAAIARCQDARGTAILTDMLDSKQQRSRMAALGALTRLPIVDMAPAVGRMIGKGRDIEASSAICAILSMGSVGADIAMRELEKHEGVLLGELEQERRDALAQLAQRSHGR
jgi:HEAT repeat protein